MSAAYTHLAKFYDRLMAVDYQRWEAYLRSILKRHNCAPQNLLDLGCGTGNLTIPLARRGYTLTGIDISAEMVGAAVAKAERENLMISFLVQDMRSLAVAGAPFDAVFSACDALNYLLTAEDLRQAFQAVGRHLKSGGLFLFDLNSAKKLRRIYGEHSYADLAEDFGYFWDNEFDPHSNICAMELTFFVRLENGFYQRISERHQQKLWYPPEIEKVAEDTGFLTLACYDFLSFEPCSQNSERWQIVLKRQD